jgi:tetratricopeptide (TPR) repeat protein
VKPASLALICLMILPLAARAQAPSTKSVPPKTRADFSREPFIIEQFETIARFESDGTGEQDLRVRVKVQSDAGVQQWSELVFGYNAGNEQIDVHYVRVRKSDGSTAEVAPDAIKDAVAAAAHDFPAYANCKERQVTVASLAPGDTLEYEVAKRIVTPEAAGEFWFEHRFIDSAVVLNERLEINVPAARKMTLKSSAATPNATATSGGRTIYRWRHANLKHAADDSQKLTDQSKAKAPDVQLTTFASWAQVARWYAKLEQGRSEPTAEIRARTQELTAGRTTDLEKMQAIYDYVSTQIRFAPLAFGAAGYQPRSAADVFASQYGDSEDKHTLLAAMLEAAGFSGDAVLISSTRKLDASVPSPAQFDHAITAVPGGKDLVWMDSTVNVAPFRMLASALRKKSALLISGDGSGKIVETPADPPFLSVQRVDIDGQVSELGKLTATAHYSVRGDTELVLRSAFHKTPESQWKQLGQTILSLDGIHGEVASVKPSDPTATHEPFALDIGFAQSNFVGWSSKRTRTALPLLAIGVPDPPRNKTQPIELGSPLKVAVSLKLRLPAAFSAQAPVGVSVAHDYAEFKSSYQFTDGVITASRSLDFKMSELPAARADDYAAFARAVTADENQPLIVENNAPGGPTIPASATADELLEAGLASFNSGDASAAIPLLERVVQLEPQHKHAWSDLGLAYLRVGKYDEGIAALRKQLEINPSDEHANEYLGLALKQQQNFDEAAAAFRKQIEIDPLDLVAHAELGEILLDQRKYAEAVTELEKATILSPKSADLQLNLGRAYANTGKVDEAVAAFDKATSLSHSPTTLNEAAFDLAEQKLALDRALRYSELAIADASAALRSADLAHVTDKALDQVEDIAAYWDTFGWIYFQKGDFDRAMPYVHAAWLLTEDGEAGDHVAQIYEKLGQKDRAIHACALALAAPHAIPDTRARLTLLLGGNAQIDELVSKAKPEMEALRTIPVGRVFAEDAKADFFVLLAPGEKKARVEAVKFISGSDALKPLAERLRTLDYGAVFPDATPAKLIRRGTLSCTAKTGECNFTLILPEDARPAQ